MKTKEQVEEDMKKVIKYWKEEKDKSDADENALCERYKVTITNMAEDGFEISENGKKESWDFPWGEVTDHENYDYEHDEPKSLVPDMIMAVAHKHDDRVQMTFSIVEDMMAKLGYSVECDEYYHYLTTEGWDVTVPWFVEELEAIQIDEEGKA